MKRKTILFLFGTRPEAVKLGPVILAVRKMRDFQVRIAVTGQHREMLDQVLTVMGLVPDADLDLMRPGQSPSGILAAAVQGLEKPLEQFHPDMVLVQGDTTTTLASALAAFYGKIPVGHVEAGLRTHDLENPFPEEANRKMVSAIAAWHFAATPLGRENLVREGVPGRRIFVTGNPVVDAVRWVLPANLPVSRGPRSGVLITAHRRENFGRPLEHICRAVAVLARRFPEMEFVFPVHPNPAVQRTVRAVFQPCPANLHLLKPLPYPDFIRRLASCRLVLTDSGGVQEEAPAVGSRVIILRQVTERPEALANGACLVAPEQAAIVRMATRLLAAPREQQTFACPFGDGRAGERIAQALAWIFDNRKQKPKPFVPKGK
jgi:UDP-N-acetylglucosamine 2-epimerase (non-hydrolysing)